MSEIVWGTSRNPIVNQGLAAYVGALVEGGDRGFGEHTSMGVIKDGRISGAAVFHNYSPEAGVMELSAAATDPHWLSRAVLFAMFDYVFNHAACRMAVLRVSEDNHRMCRIAKAYGFEEYRIPGLRGPGVAEMIYTLTDTAWAASRFHKEAA